MSGSLGDLQQRAVDLAKSNNFGAEALDVNLEIARVDAANQGAWTRLARCYLEQRRFADAAGALATVLELNPSNTIAKSLLTEVTKRRAMALPASEAATGFTAHDFDALGHLAPVEAARALAPKIELLLQSVNEQRTSVRIVEARNRAGQSGSKLFHRNSYHPGANGHIYAYHHGGRWEPQFDLGFFSATPWGANWMRIGLGFNLADSGRDERVQAAAKGDDGPEQILALLRNVSAAGRLRVARAPRRLDGEVRRVHPVRRARTGRRSASAAGRRVAHQLPQPGGSRVGVRRPMAVAREARRCADARGHAEGGRDRRGHVRRAVPALGERLRGVAPKTETLTRRTETRPES